MHKEFDIDNMENIDSQFATGKKVEKNADLNYSQNSKIKFLLMKKYELDYLYIPEHIRNKNNMKKTKICGILNFDPSEKCKCNIF